MKRREPLPRKRFFELPPLELECMKALWAQGEASVKDIRAQLNGSNGRGLAYTTIETIMDRLSRKGVVTRRKVGRAHLYTPLYEAAAARADAVEVLVHHFFGGSRRALASFLAGEPVAETAPRFAPHPATPHQPVPRLPRVSPGGTKDRPPAPKRPIASAPELKPAPAKAAPRAPARPFDPSLL